MDSLTSIRFYRTCLVVCAAMLTLGGAVYACTPPAEEESVTISLPGGREVIGRPSSLRHGAHPGEGGTIRHGGGGLAGAIEGDAGGELAEWEGGFRWSVFEPSEDSRVVYVSSSTGHDANGGLSPDDAVKTIAAGEELLREGYPDFLLLKRGDVWENEDFGRWKLSGRSTKEPMVVSSYGDGTTRPLVRTGLANRGLWLDGGQVVEHVAFTGIELHAHTYIGEEKAEAGILFLGSGGDVLIEDCLIRGYKDNIVFNGFNGDLSDIRVRGCVIVDSFSKIAHAQGLYAADMSGLLIEGCVFDHNGWSETIAGADPTIFNHNVYIQTTCSDVTVRRNVIMNGSSHGIQLRPGGECTDNVILYNPIGVLAGNGGDAPAVEVSIRGNVIMYADDITPDKPRGMGIDLQHVKSGEVEGNVLAHNQSAKPYGHAIKLHSTPAAPVSDLVISSNTIYDWQGGLKFNKEGISNVMVRGNRIQAEDVSVPIIKHEGTKIDVTYGGNAYHSEAIPVSWFQVGVDTYNFGAWKDMADDEGSEATEVPFKDVDRSPATYQTLVGGEAGLEGFVKALRGQSRSTWNDAYAAPALLSYFREGFGMEGVLDAKVGVVGR
jgi:hypothetical protein